MPSRLIVSPDARAFLKKIGQPTSWRFGRAFWLLENDWDAAFHFYDIIRVKKYPGRFRLRIGELRAVFTFEQGHVHILYVDRRGDETYL